ncbi:DUF4126 domain-containing protein [Microbacterium xanthum]|uniref:DUF4126 domain-containing protein n=1 Tax=Microbacterium xanthum TaxID=3079794 RepID=UPI002AD2AACA|nr:MULTISPECIES: DUF4126 domain-containing protein [unclassified Microbacterium]MDZ8172604.1 DUF4126 domain-containing protein [Microbacterium sp. KSW-48]MDZ8202559.1 DUF4126 domain-containing protein [Microbacterium sp. SSW1-59]
MLEFLVGTGLAASAGLNAWMPLLVLGLADRFVPAVELPATWAWLSSDLALWVVGVLLVVEIIADKVPAVDTINDVLQTVVRPASGGIVFGAGASAETVSVTDPASFFTDSSWVPILTGVVVALAVHGVKAAFRPVANAATGGIAAPVVSTIEDASALALSILALLVPVLAAAALVTAIVAMVFAVRRFRRRRGGERAHDAV